MPLILQFYPGESIVFLQLIGFFKGKIVRIQQKQRKHHGPNHFHLASCRPYDAESTCKKKNSFAPNQTLFLKVPKIRKEGKLACCKPLISIIILVSNILKTNTALPCCIFSCYHINVCTITLTCHKKNIPQGLQITP